MITRIINPLFLTNTEDERLLSNALNLISPDVAYLPAGSLLETYYDCDDQIQEKIFITITYPIIKRRSASRPQEARYEVLARLPFAEGNYGKVYDVLQTLVVNPDKSILGKKHKERVVKIQVITNNYQKIIHEIQLAKLANGFKIKEDLILSKQIDETNKKENINGTIVMERIPGKELIDVIRDMQSKNIFTILQRLKITLNLLKSYKEQVYDKKIAHRDLKPENIFLDLKTGKIVIIDYGMGLHEVDFKKGKVALGGTLGYIAPETIKSTVNMKTDLFSLAIIIACFWGGDEPPEDFSVYSFNNFLSMIAPSNPIYVPLWELVLQLHEENFNNRPDIATAIERMEKIILDYNANGDESIFFATAGDCEARVLNGLLTANTDVNKIYSIFAKFLMQSVFAYVDDEAYFKQLIAATDCYCLTNILNPNINNILTTVKNIVDNFTKVKINFKTLLLLINEENYLKERDKNKLQYELTYWLSKLEACPAKLDAMISLQDRAVEEYRKILQYFKDLRGGYLRQQYSLYSAPKSKSVLANEVNLLKRESESSNNSAPKRVLHWVNSDHGTNDRLFEVKRFKEGETYYPDFRTKPQ